MHANAYGYELKPYNKCLIQENNLSKGFYLWPLLANRKIMDKQQIEERIKDLREQQKEILKRIKNRDFTVDVIINYGKELERLSIRISEIDLLTWQ